MNEKLTDELYDIADVILGTRRNLIQLDDRLRRILSSYGDELTLESQLDINTLALATGVQIMGLQEINTKLLQMLQGKNSK